MLTRRSISTGLAATAAAGGALGLARAATAASANIWPNGAKAAVSLTYDDGLDSQLENGVGALQSAGLKATFFLTKDNIGDSIGDWVKVRSRRRATRSAITRSLTPAACKAIRRPPSRTGS
jgi:peptidoglycan/xylan/chitin deacetylase (PgdA/CDA1 family)